MLSSRNINFDGIYDIDNCRFLDEQTFIIEDQRTQLKVGDILFTSVGTIGRSCVVKEYIPICFQRSVSVLTTLVLNQYLKMVLDSPYYQTFFIKHATGTAQKGFYLNQMSKLIIPIPPLNEQYRIYNKYINKYQKRICEYNDLKTKLEKLDRNINHTLKKSILQYAIQGKLVEQNPNDEPASELIKRIRLEKEKLIKSGKLKKDKNESYIYRGSDNSYYEKFQNGKEICIDDEIPFEIPKGWEWIRLGTLLKIKSGEGLTAKNMKSGNIPVYGGNGIAGYHNQSLVSKGTVIIGRVGFYCGSVHITKSDAWVTDNAFIVQYPTKYVFRDYLVYTLKFMNLGKSNNATAQPVVSGKKIYPKLFPLPPIAEQQRIVNKINSLNALL